MRGLEGWNQQQEAREIQGQNAHATHEGILGTEPEGIFHQLPEAKRYQQGGNTSKNTLKGVSQVSAKQEIKHDDYVNVIETNEAVKKEVA